MGTYQFCPVLKELSANKTFCGISDIGPHFFSFAFFMVVYKYLKKINICDLYEVDIYKNLTCIATH